MGKRIKSLIVKSQLSITPIYLLIPFGLALLFRCWGIRTSSIWYDEALTIYLTKEPLINMVKMISAELNPPLWEILEWTIVRLLFPSEISYRLLSLISSLGLMVIAHKILVYFQASQARQFLTLSILALSPYQIWMAQDARVYALMSFLYLLGFWFLIQRRWWGLFACCGLLLYSNSASVFYVLTLLVVGLILYHQNISKLFGVGVGASLVYSPWFIGAFINNLAGEYFRGYNIPPVNTQRLIEQMQLIFMIGMTSNRLVGDLLRLLNAFFVLVPLVTMGIIESSKIIRLFSKDRAGMVSMLLISILPLALITLTAWLYQNGHLILYRSLSPIAVPIILMLAVCVKTHPKLSTALLSILIVLNISYHFIWSPLEKGGYLKEVIQELSFQDKENNVIFHATATSLLPFQYYLKDASHYLLEADLPAWFLVEPLQQAFGLRKITPEQIPSDNYWVVWAKDAHLPLFVSQVMNEIVHEEQLVAKIEYPQMSPIYIYYVSQTTSSTNHP
ncbi:MAG: hypothetical protein AB1457_11230 [Chloroflexota bacterium]